MSPSQKNSNKGVVNAQSVLDSARSAALADAIPQETAGELVAGRDFTMENGMMVLTPEFLLRRGQCCGSGCRNCPYSAE